MPTGRMRALRRDGALCALSLSCVFVCGLNTTTTAAIPQLVIGAGGSLVQAGMLNAAFIAGAIALRVPCARLIDRQGSRRALLMGALAFLAGEPLYAMNAAVSIAVARMMQALGLALFMPAVSAYVLLVAPDGQCGRWLGIVRVMQAIAAMTFPLVFLPLVEADSLREAFLALTACGAVGAILVALLRREPLMLSWRNGTGSSGSKKSLAGRMAPVLLTQFVVAVAYSSMFLFGTVYLNEAAPSVNAGAMLLYLGIGQIVAGVALGRIADDRGFKRTIVMSSMTLALSLWMLGVAGPIPVVILGGVGCGVGYYGCEIACLGLASACAGLREEGRAASMVQNALDAGLMVGSVLFGFVSVGGSGRTVVLGAAASTVALCAAWWYVKRGDHDGGNGPVR